MPDRPLILTGLLVARDGEQAFRSMESACLKRFPGGGRSVVATGGGVVLAADNYAKIRNQGASIWLYRCRRS